MNENIQTGSSNKKDETGNVSSAVSSLTVNKEEKKEMEKEIQGTVTNVSSAVTNVSSAVNDVTANKEEKKEMGNDMEKEIKDTMEESEGGKEKRSRRSGERKATYGLKRLATKPFISTKGLAKFFDMTVEDMERKINDGEVSFKITALGISTKSVIEWCEKNM